MAFTSSLLLTAEHLRRGSYSPAPSLSEKLPLVIICDIEPSTPNGPLVAPSHPCSGPRGFTVSIAHPGVTLVFVERGGSAGGSTRVRLAAVHATGVAAVETPLFLLFLRKSRLGLSRSNRAVITPLTMKKVS